MSYQASLIFENELQPKQGTKIPYGIHTNCEVVSVERGDRFVDINFKDSENRTHNKRLWDANGNYPKTDKNGVTETKEQALRREEQSNLAHIVKLMHIFLGQEAINKFPALDYDAFVERAIKELTPKLKNTKVNLKLIFDSENKYSTFGNFPDYIEQHIEGEAPTLTFSKWELEHRSGSAKSDNTPSPGANALSSLLS